MPPRNKNEQTSDSLMSDIERAEQAAQARLAAPDVTIQSLERSREKEIVRTFAKDCVNENGKMAEFHPFWGDPSSHEKYIQDGYIPVAHNGQHVSYEGVKLYKLPMELHKRNLKMNAMVSKRMLGEAAEADQNVKSAVIAGQAMGEEKVSMTQAKSQDDVRQAMLEMDRWDREK